MAPSLAPVLYQAVSFAGLGSCSRLVLSCFFFRLSFGAGQRWPCGLGEPGDSTETGRGSREMKSCVG